MKSSSIVGKAVVFGILAWVLVFVVFSILMFIPGLKEVHYLLVLLELVAVALISYILAVVFFAGRRVDLQSSLMVAIWWLVVGAILDAIITIPLFVLPNKGSYGAFFSSTSLWAGYLIIIVMVALVGSVCGKRVKKAKIAKKAKKSKRK